MSQRWPALVVTLGLGWFLYLQARSAWNSYWLLKDGQQGMAVVVKEHWGGHNKVIYNYVVNQKEYTGTSSRSWDNERYRNVQPGQESVVFYSASHPWLSALSRPRTVVEGLPVVLIVLVLETFAVVALIKPGSRWGFDFSDAKEKATPT